jgi:hypothetical protein
MSEHNKLHASKASDLPASDPFETLLLRSDEFESALMDCFPSIGFVLADESAKFRLAATACALSTEHASVLRRAFGGGAPNSGAALLRLQYEALLRAAWLVHVASPDQVTKLSSTLSIEAEQAAKNLPGYLDMLASVAKSAPEGLYAPLAEFNQYSRHALNSFVHAGIHPLRRAQEGFPLELALRLVVMSNGLMHQAYRVLASLSGSRRRMDKVTNLYREFVDCWPLAANTGPTGGVA